MCGYEYNGVLGVRLETEDSLPLRCHGAVVEAGPDTVFCLSAQH